MKNENGISLITLIVTIIVIIIITAMSVSMNNSALNSMSEAKFKTDLRGLSDRLKIYHEKAELADFKYKKDKLSWNGGNSTPEHTGKVADGVNEDTADFIFGEIPKYFDGKIAIENGKITFDYDKYSDDERIWIAQLDQIDVLIEGGSETGGDTGGETVDETLYTAKIGSSYYEALQEAINNVPTTNVQTTVTLLKDVEENITIGSSQNVNLDLQSYTINVSNNTAIINNGSLSISNGKIISSKTAISNEGTLNISGTVDISSPSTDFATIVVAANATTTILGGKVSGTNYMVIENSGALNIGGTADIKSTAPKKDINAIKNNSGATLNIYGGTIARDSSGYSGATIYNSGSATMSAGLISTNAKAGAIDNGSQASFEISGGRIVSTGTRQAIYNNGGTVTISGNDTYLEAKADVESNNQRGTVHNLNSGTITITGGKIVSKKAGVGIGLSNASGTVTIGTNDGTISTTSPIILGKKYGVKNASTTYFYDGKLGGDTSVSDSAGRNGTLNIPDNTTINEGAGITETIDGVSYNVAYLIND